MITVIALNEKEEPIKLSVKGLVVLETENVVCVDADIAEKLAKHLDTENADLAAKIRKLIPLEE